MAEPYLNERFIRDAWYVAAWDHEIGAEGLFARKLLGQPDERGQLDKGDKRLV